MNQAQGEISKFTFCKTLCSRVVHDCLPLVFRFQCWVGHIIRWHVILHISKFSINVKAHLAHNALYVATPSIFSSSTLGFADVIVLFLHGCCWKQAAFAWVSLTFYQRIATFWRLVSKLRNLVWESLQMKFLFFYSRRAEKELPWRLTASYSDDERELKYQYFNATLDRAIDL